MAETHSTTAAAAEAEMTVNESAQAAQAAPAEAPKLDTSTETGPAAATKQATQVDGGPTWPAIDEGSVMEKFIQQVPQITKDAEYDEVFGIHLNGGSEFHRNLILQKFLRANANDFLKATKQLSETLRWRKEFQPHLLPSQTFSKDKFGGLAFINTLHNAPGSPNKSDVACWNIYGSVTDNEKTFGDLDQFTRWRVAVMEAALARLSLNEATEPIPNYGAGVDPYQMVQIHDYKNVSFLRQDPHAKAAAKKAIDTFSAYYPETLSRKMFVNVPTIMGWMFTAMKMVLSRETVRKFTVISDGRYLSSELGNDVPKEYGGTGDDLENAEQLKLE